MESLVYDYLSTTCDDEINECLLERRLSPYATLRPGDLAALLRLQTPLLSSLFKFSQSNENLLPCVSNEFDAISERHEDALHTDEIVRDSTEVNKTIDVVCRGTDTNNSPAEYTVKGLHHHEMPVIGIFVDKRICPGFRYLVRRADSNRFFFNNEPKALLSIGMGYGKRITFTGESLNHNECYFWSDSEPNGYAFSIHAVDVGQRFSIVDANNVIVGETVVNLIIEPQQEVSSIVKDRTVTKHVKVTMTCSMKYYQLNNHGLVDMMVLEDLETVTGEAVLTKSRSNKTASLNAIEQVFLQPFGLCTLKPDV